MTPHGVFCCEHYTAEKSFLQKDIVQLRISFWEFFSHTAFQKKAGPMCLTGPAFQSFISKFSPHASLRKSSNRRNLISQLGPGTLTSHERSSLVLLCSHPDTVQKFPLHETRTSTPLNKGSSTKLIPRIGITPAIADFRLQGAAAAPAVRYSLLYPRNPVMSSELHLFSPFESSAAIDFSVIS